ncbi:MAG: hypothetical protein WBC01_13050 [Solirubrobacterales bacterium]
MAAFTLTIRSGPSVERESHETLEDAVGALRDHVEAIQATDNLPAVKMLRTFEPGQRVKGRVEISTGKIFRRREAGVDVMGDGSIVPFIGGSARDHLDPPEGADYARMIAAALRG